MTPRQFSNILWSVWRKDKTSLIKDGAKFFIGQYPCEIRLNDSWEYISVIDDERIVAYTSHPDIYVWQREPSKIALAKLKLAL